ncbi:hypothetical protein QBC44DRAFT_371287 [Cladorrhinum sp. PSN332]|nr:hypothetical protein QBC44DRAFT_371287 [Cladorrhinum sp. PSN332]
MPDVHIGTVNLMMKKLDEIKCIRYKVSGALPHNDGHMKCRVKHKETIRRIKEQPVKLTRNLAAELRYHGKKIGAFREDLEPGQ